jgi:lysophospholipase L1-like esterase
VYFADRIVVPYEPRIIVMYAGDNDIAGGKTPCEVHGDFEKFVSLVHEKLPETRIVYVAIKPSLKRWKLVHQMRAANALILATCLEDERLEFVDIDAPMIGDGGQPRPELFVEDGLHLSATGYELWSDLVVELAFVTRREK